MVGGAAHQRRGADTALTGFGDARRAKKKAPGGWGFRASVVGDNAIGNVNICHDKVVTTVRE